jgi:hypothetical protein
MRWLAVWIFLAGVYLAGQLAIPLLLGGSWSYTREDLAHLAAVPLIQVVALWVLAVVRRGVRR